MSINRRLKKAEDYIGDAVLWSEVRKLASETGEDPTELYRESREVIDRYWHLARPLTSGWVDIEPVLRAVAKGEDLDYEELLKEAKRSLRNLRRRVASRQL